MPPKPAAGLPTEVVNDKGRYHSLKSTARGRSCGSRLLAFVATLPLEGEDAPNFPEADLWPGITSGLPFAQNPKVMPDIESKLNLLMVSFARRRGDAAEFVDGVEQGNESFVFRLSVFLALWTISHCEALAIGFKIEVSRWMTAFTSLLLRYRPPRCTCRISR